MKASAILLTVVALAAAPVALALTAFVTGLWQPSGETPLREEELGV